MPTSERRNPGVDMQTTAPQPQLADPGIGLRDNGRRVLAYADLRSVFADPDGREPERTIELHLTGHMERFMWSFDGIPFASAEPLALRYGERVRIRLVNDTMMSHPIHLHGMWSDLEDEAGGLSRAQAHDQHAARHAAFVPRDGRRARALGVPLPSAVSHGSRHVPRGARRCVTASRLRVHSVGSRARRPSLRSSMPITVRRRAPRSVQPKSPLPSAPPHFPISPTCG